MAKLMAATRNALPASKFAMPKARKYPLTDKIHDVKAEQFATKEEHKGKISPSTAATIRSKAKRAMGK